MSCAFSIRIPGQNVNGKSRWSKARSCAIMEEQKTKGCSCFMRCRCKKCPTYMVQAESEHLGCVCPDCGCYRCTDCLGTNNVVQRDHQLPGLDLAFPEAFTCAWEDEEDIRCSSGTPEVGEGGRRRGRIGPSRIATATTSPRWSAGQARAADQPAAVSVIWKIAMAASSAKTRLPKTMACKLPKPWVQAFKKKCPGLILLPPHDNTAAEPPGQRHLSDHNDQ